MASGVVVLLLSLIPGALLDIVFTNNNCSYYWTLYTGEIPQDAIPGGRDSSGDIFYIGLVQLKLINETFAGMIIPKKQTARITSLGMTKEVKNDPFTVVNILCSSDIDAFKWISTNSESLQNLTNLVNGGKVLGQDLYIGRVLHNENVALGKVFPHKFIYQGLYIPSGGVFAQYMSYEVLTFKCDNKTSYNFESEYKNTNSTEAK